MYNKSHRINTSLKWSNLELSGLLEDEDARVCFQRAKRHLALHPFHLTDLNKALREILDSTINCYDTELQGLVLAYKNPKLLSPLGSIRHDSFFIHIDIEADFYIFKPEIDCVLKGTANKKAPSHIGVLTHKAFNVSIPKAEDCDEWLGDYVFVGQEVKFTVTHLDFKGKLPFIRGELIADGISCTTYQNEDALAASDQEDRKQFLSDSITQNGVNCNTAEVGSKENRPIASSDDERKKEEDKKIALFNEQKKLAQAKKQLSKKRRSVLDSSSDEEEENLTAHLENEKRQQISSDSSESEFKTERATKVMPQKASKLNGNLITEHQGLEKIVKKKTPQKKNQKDDFTSDTSIEPDNDDDRMRIKKKIKRLEIAKPAENKQKTKLKSSTVNKNLEKKTHSDLTSEDSSEELEESHNKNSQLNSLNVLKSLNKKPSNGLDSSDSSEDESVERKPKITSLSRRKSAGKKGSKDNDSDSDSEIEKTVDKKSRRQSLNATKSPKKKLSQVTTAPGSTDESEKTVDKKPQLKLLNVKKSPKKKQSNVLDSSDSSEEESAEKKTSKGNNVEREEAVDKKPELKSLNAEKSPKKKQSNVLDSSESSAEESVDRKPIITSLNVRKSTPKKASKGNDSASAAEPEESVDKKPKLKPSNAEKSPKKKQSSVLDSSESSEEESVDRKPRITSLNVRKFVEKNASTGKNSEPEKTVDKKPKKKSTNVLDSSESSEEELIDKKPRIVSANQEKPAKQKPSKAAEKANEEPEESVDKKPRISSLNVEKSPKKKLPDKNSNSESSSGGEEMADRKPIINQRLNVEQTSKNKHKNVDVTTNNIQESEQQDTNFVAGNSENLSPKKLSKNKRPSNLENEDTRVESNSEIRVRKKKSKKHKEDAEKSDAPEENIANTSQNDFNFVIPEIKREHKKKKRKNAEKDETPADKNLPENAESMSEFFRDVRIKVEPDPSDVEEAAPKETTAKRKRKHSIIKSEQKSKNDEVFGHDDSFINLGIKTEPASDVEDVKPGKKKLKKRNSPEELVNNVKIKVEPNASDVEGSKPRKRVKTEPQERKVKVNFAD